MISAYLLDTNVVSETKRSRAAPLVTKFLVRAGQDRVFLSVLTIGELRKGAALKRRTDQAGADLLDAWIDLTEANFANRLLAVDARVATVWGNLSSSRSLPVVDTLIAATAIVHGLALVTRNIADFAFTGLTLVNPWDKPAGASA